MKNTLKIDFNGKKIVMDRTFAKYAESQKRCLYKEPCLKKIFFKFG